MDRIKIQELEVFANHGVYPEENALGQKFVISADLYTDTRPAGKAMIWSSPSTMESVPADQRIRGRPYLKLLESVAELLAFELLTAWPRIRKIRLEIRKPWLRCASP